MPFQLVIYNLIQNKISTILFISLIMFQHVFQHTTQDRLPPPSQVRCTLVCGGGVEIRLLPDQQLTIKSILDPTSFEPSLYDVSECRSPSTVHCLAVCLYACLTAQLPVCLSVCWSVCLSVCLSAGLSVCMSACLSVGLHSYLSACRSVGLSACLFVFLSVCVCLSVSLPVCLSVRLSACPSVFITTYKKLSVMFLPYHLYSTQDTPNSYLSQ